MAVIENRTTEEGDVLIIKPEVPVVGLISLYDFVDTTVGESATDYYKKEFRYSVNGGITFSSWLELTVINIQEVEISRENQFVIEYRYTRVGNAPEVDLEFEDILVSGNYDPLNYEIYDELYIKDFYQVNDINVYGWALNVLEKLYLKGILPEYMTRGEKSADVLEDQDFLNFWLATTHFFAIIVYFARQFRDITSRLNLVEYFLTVRGIEVGNATFEDVVKMFSSYVDEYEKRGTEQILDKKIDGADFDGEFIRMIGYTSPEEFIFAPLKPSETGWCIGKSSPMWKGTENIVNVIKGYEFTDDVVDLAKYPLANTTNISLVDGKMVISGVLAAEYAGVYPTADTTMRLKVNKNLDYEISFKVESTYASTPLTFGVVGYDASGGIVNLKSAIDGVFKNDFFVQSTLKLTGVQYFIRGIIFNQNKEVDVDLTMIPSGVHLKFDPLTEIKYIVPKIIVDRPLAQHEVKITEIKIRPLHTPFSRGQLGMNNIILAYLKNNNYSDSTINMERKIRESLIPGNSFFKAKYL